MNEGWKRTGTSLSANGTIRYAELDGVYRATLEEVFEVATSERRVRERLAERLEKIAAELRSLR